MVPCLRGKLIDLWLEEQKLHVRLTSNFSNEIDARKQAIREWRQHRRDHTEELSAIPPRLHYYLFTQRALPMMVHDDPGNFVRLMESPVASTFLNVVWDTLGKALEPSDYISSMEWNTAIYRPEPTIEVLCLRFSPPVQEQEVWMAAVVVMPGKKRLFLPISPQCRFFTLESGLKFRDGDQMVLWEWEKGLHRYFSQVVTMEEREFVQAAFGLSTKV